jgi:hypothetical protein
MKKKKHKCHFSKLHKLVNEITKLTEKEQRKYRTPSDCQK